MVCACQTDMAAAVAQIVARHPAGRSSLIPILQDIQEHFGYLSPESLHGLKLATGISENEAYGVATFYTQFRFTPSGKHKVQVCNGTACHVRDGERITGELTRQLGVPVGGTTPDNEFSLEQVACLGCCALSPVVAVDGKVYAQMTPKKVAPLLKEHRNQGKTPQP